MKSTLSLFALFGSAAALCPGEPPCGAKGTCGEHDKCTCFPGYAGQDCSQRTCNHHTAWNHISEETISSLDDSTSGAYKLVKHGPTECSSKGDCDRDSGECKCYDGYTGKGCRRMECDGGSTCSGHGQCRSLSDVASTEGYAKGYNGWDKDMIQSCDCDPGWSGVACTDRLCPVGDDPLSTGQVNTVVYLGTGHYAAAAADGAVNNPSYLDATGTGDAYTVEDLEFTLSYVDAYGKTWTTWGISAHDTSRIAVAEALEALPNAAIPEVTVTEVTSLDAATNFEQSSGTDVSLTAISKILKIEFTHGRNSGDQSSKLTVNTNGCTTHGCPNYFVGTAFTTGAVTGATVKSPVGASAKIYKSGDGTAIGSASPITIAPVVGTKESHACSGRGSCDSEKGVCECFSGYTGNSCETQTTVM
jgi:hypothetical protein